MHDLETIVHPTDFSEASAEAFVHALRIAVAAKATLVILHVTADPGVDEWSSFPQVRQTLAAWGLMEGTESTAEIQVKTGVKVVKIALMPQSPIDAILGYLDKHHADLMVLATEAREGVSRWLHGSVAEQLARHARTPTLFVSANARGFVDPVRGEVRLRHVLIPVDHEPGPAKAITAITGFARLMAGIEAEPRLLHVGKEPPKVSRHAEPHRPLPVALRHGDVLDAILDVANDWPADLIGMATAGHHGFLDALRGSTTERVLRQAPCPVLAVPVGR